MSEHEESVPGLIDGELRELAALLDVIGELATPLTDVILRHRSVLAGAFGELGVDTSAP